MALHDDVGQALHSRRSGTISLAEVASDSAIAINPRSDITGTGLLATGAKAMLRGVAGPPVVMVWLSSASISFRSAGNTGNPRVFAQSRQRDVAVFLAQHESFRSCGETR